MQALYLRQTALFIQSRNCYKSVLSRPPHLQKISTVKSQLLQDHHTYRKYQLLNICSFMTTTLPKVETVTNLFFQDHYTCRKYQLLKLVPSRPPHLPKVSTVKNQLFHDYHTQPYKKLLKISSFMITTPNHIRNC